MSVIYIFGYKPNYFISSKFLENVYWKLAIHPSQINSTEMLWSSGFFSHLEGRSSLWKENDTEGGEKLPRKGSCVVV